MNRKVIAACADAFFPPFGPIPISGTDANLVNFFEDSVLHAPKLQASLLKLLILFVQYLPLILGPTRKRFTSLSQKQREETLSKMSLSNFAFLRTCFQSLRMIFCMGYFEDKRVSRLIFKQF
jgi:hypothetical protein